MKRAQPEGLRLRRRGRTPYTYSGWQSMHNAAAARPLRERLARGHLVLDEQLHLLAVQRGPLPHHHPRADHLALQHGLRILFMLRHLHPRLASEALSVRPSPPSPPPSVPHAHPPPPPASPPSPSPTRSRRGQRSAPNIRCDLGVVTPAPKHAAPRDGETASDTIAVAQAASLSSAPDSTRGRTSSSPPACCCLACLRGVGRARPPQPGRPSSLQPPSPALAWADGQRSGLGNRLP